MSALEEYHSALQHSFKKLTASDRTTQEVRSFLRQYSETAVEHCIEFLTECGFLNDERLAVDLAQKNEGRKAIGITLLRQKLEAKGVPPEIVSMILIDRVNGEHARAGTLLQSKYPNSTSRAKAARYLWSRGFEESTIESVIDELHPEPDE